jgi:transcriptional regulator with AAA-type ATPase domain
MRDELTRDEPTRTEAAEPTRDAEREALGIFWLTPKERFHELLPGAIFGRSPDCALCLEGSSVSRQHARLEKGGPLWMLRDLDSKNGVYLNAQRRELTPLQAQDTVRIGEWVGVVCVMPRSALESGLLFDELAPGVWLSAPTLGRLGHFRALSLGQLPILIVGETGTGKEVLARALHRASGRPGPLVAVNCAAIPESLAESELFGHQKGAFTSAVRSSPGHMLAADHGTLLLDEVVELSAGIQSKLLRALEERAVTPVGSSQAIGTDFRLIAACQTSLERLVAEGQFRGDLYARLNGASLELPPLRKRRQEVLRLLRDAMTRELGFAPGFDRRFVERVCAYSWPYNVRELVQLARLLCAAPRPEFDAGDLPAQFHEAPPEPAAALGSLPRTPKLSPRRQTWLDRYSSELESLKRALSQCEGNVYRAALLAGIPRHRARRLLAAEAALHDAEPAEPSAVEGRPSSGVSEA